MKEVKYPIVLSLYFLVPLFLTYLINPAVVCSGNQQQLSLDDFQETPVDRVLVAATLRRLCNTEPEYIRRSGSGKHIASLRLSRLSECHPQLLSMF
jgi:hypothetical protein